MIEAINDRETVAIDASVHEIYKQFTEGSNMLEVPFKSMKDVFMWATCLGVKLGIRRPLKNRQVIFRWSQFDTQIDLPLLKAIAIASKNEIDTLKHRDEILTIAEEFANGGIHELNANLLDDFGQPLWNLVSMLSEH